MTVTLDIAAVLATLIWPIMIMIVLFVFRDRLPGLAEELAHRVKKVELPGLSFEVEPAQGLRPPSAVPNEDRARLTQNLEPQAPAPQAPLPFDTYFLNHSSFLRKDKQAEFRQRTGVPLDHYDIRVIVDSYYRGALERVAYVEYVLHRSYPAPIQKRYNPEDKFLLKELANGEYVLMAKVFLKDRKEPVLLQRYITLWECGPRLV